MGYSIFLFTVDYNMGNNIATLSKDDVVRLKPQTIDQVVNYIATKYIISMDFTNLKNLYDDDYCRQLTILTSGVIEKYFTDLDVTYLSQRLKHGVEINELKNDKLTFFNAADLKKKDVQNTFKKKQMCIGISRFYVQIANIFATIATTVNPIYRYIDAASKKDSQSSSDPIKASRKPFVGKNNICQNRVNILQYHTIPGSDAVTLNPPICNSSNNKTLIEEPGIPEFVDLYFDDKYNYATGKFEGLSKAAQKRYNKDLKIFYAAFTDSENPMPSNITKFSDIKVNISTTAACTPTLETPIPALSRKIKVSTSNSLMETYAKNIKEMQKKAAYNRNGLIDILNRIFVYFSPAPGVRQVRINPSLTQAMLDDIVIELQAKISKLYTTCEKDYIRGVRIYEALVEQQIIQTTERQINTLTNMVDNLRR